jgi:hypothetical protein
MHTKIDKLTSSSGVVQELELFNSPLYLNLTRTADELSEEDMSTVIDVIDGMSDSELEYFDKVLSGGLSFIEIEAVFGRAIGLNALSPDYQQHLASSLGAMVGLVGLAKHRENLSIIHEYVQWHLGPKETTK